jgi:hypothetical protein
MSLDYQTRIELSLDVKIKGLIILSGECIAHVDYGSDGDQPDWEITAFEFSNYQGDQKVIIKDDHQPLFGLCLNAVEDESILDNLSDLFACSQDDDSGYFHSAKVSS